MHACSSDSEVITMDIVGEFLAIETDKEDYLNGDLAIEIILFVFDNLFLINI